MAWPPTVSAEEVFDPVDGSGNPRGADMGQAQTLLMEIEQKVDELANAADTIVIGDLPVATDAEVQSGAANKLLKTSQLNSAAALETITYASTVTLDWDTFLNAQITLTGNITLQNPTNVKPGTVRYLWLVQDATGGRTVSLGSNFKGSTPTIQTAANAVTLLTLIARTSSWVVISSINGGV
jgi:hypothetical protein